MDYMQLGNVSNQIKLQIGLFKQIYSFLKYPIDRLISLHKIDELYTKLSGIIDNKQFLQALLSVMNVSLKVKNDEATLIPQDGRIIVVANHPFGGLEGIILATILTDVRQDVKVMANHLLKAIQSLWDLFIFVDPFGQKDSVINNIIFFKEAVQWVNAEKMEYFLAHHHQGQVCEAVGL